MSFRERDAQRQKSTRSMRRADAKAVSGAGCARAGEQFQTRSMADPQYLAILAKGSELFIPGMLGDDLWRVI